MTPDEKRDIVQALHDLELKLGVQLARLETKVEGQELLKRRVDYVENKLETETLIMRDRSNRLLVGLVVVAILAMGSAVTRTLPFFL